MIDRKNKIITFVMNTLMTFLKQTRKMTYFFYPMNERLSDDGLLESLNDLVLVDSINEDGIYVWNEGNHDNWEDGCEGPYRIQQYVNNELVNDVYYTGVDDELIHLYPNKKLYELDHATDEEIVNAGDYLVVWSIGEGAYYDVPSEFSQGELAAFASYVKEVMMDVSSHEYPQIPISRVSSIKDTGMYFTHIKYDNVWENFEDDFTEYNTAFWVEDGKIQMKCDVRDILNEKGENLSGIEIYELINKYDDLVL